LIQQEFKYKKAFAEFLPIRFLTKNFPFKPSCKLNFLRSSYCVNLLLVV